VYSHHKIQTDSGSSQNCNPAQMTTQEQFGKCEQDDERHCTRHIDDDGLIAVPKRQIIEGTMPLKLISRAH